MIIWTSVSGCGAFFYVCVFVPALPFLGLAFFFTVNSHSNQSQNVVVFCYAYVELLLRSTINGVSYVHDKVWREYRAVVVSVHVV